MNKYRECPFCGGNAALKGLYSRRRDEYLVYVQCQVCGVRGRVYLSWPSPADSEWKNDACTLATDAWNLRREDSIASWGM